LALWWLEKSVNFAYIYFMKKKVSSELNKESFIKSLSNLIAPLDSPTPKPNKRVPAIGVLSALSGGPDSVALLHLLQSASKDLGLRIVAAHVNYGLRGKESIQDEKFCRALCNGLGVELVVYRVDLRSNIGSSQSGIRKQIKGNLQSLARNFRYRQFEQACKARKLKFIATGHNQSDNVETILMNLSRGTGTFGLGGIKQRTRLVIRPLIEYSREQILEYLEANKLSYRTDSSNSENKYTRNKVRNQLIPSLVKTLGSGAVRNISRTASLLSEHEQYLRLVGGKLLTEDSNLTPGGKIVIDLKRFKKYHVLIQRIVIALCYEKLTGSLNDFERAATERVLEMLETGIAQVDLKKGIFAEVVGDKLYFYKGIHPVKMRKINSRGVTSLDGLGVKIKFQESKIEGVTKKSLSSGKNLRVFLDKDAIKLPLVVRTMQVGDRFQPLGMTTTKKLSDFFVDRKVPRPLREETPLVISGNEIVWIVGHEISESAKIKRTTKEVVELEVTLSNRPV
jgi:tRNA(Ile)-lysidine synthase